MKGSIVFMIALLTMLIFASAAQSQILKRLKNRVQQKVEDKVEQKVNRELDQAAEDMVEKSWNTIFGEGFGLQDSSGFSYPLNSNVPTEELYQFDVVTTMEIQNFEPNGSRQQPIVMHMHINESAEYTGTRIVSDEMGNSEGEMFIIYDVKNGAMIMLLDTENGKQSLVYDWNLVAGIEGQNPAGTEPDDETFPDLTKLGTRMIAGQRCEGYLAEDEFSKSEIWISPDQNAGFQSMFRVNPASHQLKGKVPENYPEGMVMEMTYEDLKSGHKTLLKVTDIDRSANVTISMSDYTKLSMGN
jgi:hypothetical protein